MASCLAAWDVQVARSATLVPYVDRYFIVVLIVGLRKGLSSYCLQRA
jgi:hypothetical protein